MPTPVLAVSFTPSTCLPLQLGHSVETYLDDVWWKGAVVLVATAGVQVNLYGETDRNGLGCGVSRILCTRALCQVHPINLYGNLGAGVRHFWLLGNRCANAMNQRHRLSRPCDVGQGRVRSACNAMRTGARCPQAVRVPACTEDIMFCAHAESESNTIFVRDPRLLRPRCELEGGSWRRVVPERADLKAIGLAEADIKAAIEVCTLLRAAGVALFGMSRVQTG